MSDSVPLAVAIDAIHDVQAAAVAVSLLATTARARRQRDTMEPALECFAAGVEDSSQHRDRVRVQLLFEGGTVLPVEMARDAGEAFCRELADWLADRQTGLHHGKA